MKKLSKLMAGCAACLLSASVNSAIVTLNGTDVSFTFDDASLFGSASVIGNSLIFTPTSFSASSSNGAGAVQTTDTLNIKIETTTAGFNLTSFSVLELGDYSVSGSTNNGNVATGVSASTRLQVNSLTTTCGVFNLACLDSTIANTGLLTDTGGGSVNWNLAATVDLADTAGWGSDTWVNAQIQNNLNATSLTSGENAFIQKKASGVVLTVNPVPVPAAVWLFGSGLLGLVAMGRRKPG